MGTWKENWKAVKGALPSFNKVQFFVQNRNRWNRHLNKNRFFDATKHAIIWFSEYGVHSFFSGLLILQLFLDDYNRKEKRWILHCSICRCTQYIIWLYRDYSIAQEMYFLDITPFPCLYFQAWAVSDTSFCCIKITDKENVFLDGTTLSSTVFENHPKSRIWFFF